MLDLFEREQNFQNFIDVGNTHVINALNDKSFPIKLLLGSEFSGKTHLLKAFCKFYKKSYYLKFVDLIDNYLIDDIICRIKTFDICYLAIDDIDAVGLAHVVEADNNNIIDNVNSICQRNLFNLINLIKIHDIKFFMLLSSKLSLKELQTINFRTDVLTRISSGLTIELNALDDEQLVTALDIFLKDNYIEVESEVKMYIIKHYDRNFGKIIALVDQLLDLASIGGKSLTIPFISKHMIV